MIVYSKVKWFSVEQNLEEFIVESPNLTWLS